MKYDMIITQNGKEVFRDSGITQVGGDYRNVIFKNSERNFSPSKKRGFLLFAEKKSLWGASCVSVCVSSSI